MGTYKKVFLTQTAVNTLKGELRHLRRRLHNVSDELKAARDTGGMFENGDLEVAEDDWRQVNGRIDEINTILSHSQALRPASGRIFVGLGSTVKLREGHQTWIYRLVESLEADPARHKISDQSPLGQALLGREVGEEVCVPTGTGQRCYKVLSIF